MLETSLIIVGSSAAVLAALGLLFHVEYVRGSRLFLTNIRGWLDRVVQAFWLLCARVGKWLGVGTIRIVLHFVIHTVLSVCLAVLQFVQKRVLRLQQRNRSVVKSIKSEKENSHLDSIAEHKESVSLSATEKQALRDRTLEG